MKNLNYLLHNSKIFTNFVMQSRETCRLILLTRSRRKNQKQEAMKTEVTFEFKWWRIKIKVKFKS